MLIRLIAVDTEDCFVNPGVDQEWGTGDEKIVGLFAGAKYALRINYDTWNVYEADSFGEITGFPISGLFIDYFSTVEVVKVEPQAIGTLYFLSVIEE